MVYETVPESDERLPCVVRRIRRVNTVMQMDLDFAPAPLAVLREDVEQFLIVVFGRVEERVLERRITPVPPLVKDPRV